MISEWCTDLSGDYEQAEKLGIRRIELCSALEVGGLTPGPSTIRSCRKRFGGEIYTMIRPRGGDFNYSFEELAIMEDEIKIAAQMGADGVVYGCLSKTNSLDQSSTMKLKNMADALGLKSTFHRAIDLCSRPEEALQLLEKMRFDFVLTSGRCETAIEGVDQIQQWSERYNLSFLAGSGVRFDQVPTWKRSGVSGIHFTSRKLVSHMPLSMGSTYQDDPDKMKHILDAIKSE